MSLCRAFPFALYLLLLCLVLSSQHTARASEPTAEELVRAYECYLGVLHRATFSVHTELYSDSAKVPRDGPCAEFSIRYWRDGKRTKMVDSATARWYLPGGKLRTNKNGGERIFTEKQRFTIRYDETGKQPAGIVATLGIPSVDERPRIDLFSPLIDGNVFDNRLPLPDTLRNSKLSVTKGDLEGRRHWIVEGTGKWGRNTLWLDPGRGDLPVRFVQRKGAADWLSDSTLANVPKSMGGPWTEYHLRVDATAVSVIGGQSVLTALTGVRQVHGAEGKVTERFVVSLKDINLDPDFSMDPFVPTVPIPEGFQVTVKGQEQIDHEWRNGRIVKRVSEGSVTNLVGNWFQGGSMLGRGLLLLGLLAVAGLGVALWLRYRRAAAG